MRSNMGTTTYETVLECKIFAEDKRYGHLFISRDGRVYCIFKGTPMEIFTEKGGWRGSEAVIRWMDKKTNTRKKAYIKRLLSDFYG